MSGRSLNYSRTILSWVKEWGYNCGFVTVQADDAGGHASPAPPADIRDSASKLSVVSPKLNTIVVADGDLSAWQVVLLKEYLMPGGWLIMPSPEDGKPSEELEALLQLKPSRSATLVAPESPYSDPLGAEEVRLLVSHPIAPGLEIGQWQEWMGPSAKVLYARQDEALPLFCFRRPELPAVRLIPLGDGGVVHWNFPFRPGPLIEEMELKAFLGQTLTWLWGRASWAKPVEKEGTVPGSVRKKDGTAIPAAKVTARVFSESGEAVRTLEATSSKDGKFSLPLYADGIYWVKAEAEGYYQADTYLLARPKEAEGEQIEVTMEPEGTIFGHAYYGPGEDHPAVGISVTLAPNCRISCAWEKETVTDGKARFSFDHLPGAQTFYLIAKAEGWMGLQEAPVPLDGGGLEIDVHLESPTRIDGTTVNVVTRQPLAGVEIVADARSGIRRLFRDALGQTAISDQDGKFTLLLLPGYWEYLEYMPGFASMGSGGRINVSESGQSEPSELRLYFCPAASLHGRIFRSSGEFAAGAKVAVSDVEYHADEKGEYRTVPVTPAVTGGRYAQFYVRADWNDESGSCNAIFTIASVRGTEPVQPEMDHYETLLAGGFPIDVRLKPSEPKPESSGTTIAGVVLDESGRPVSSAVVELAEPSASDDKSWGLSFSPRARTRSDSEGNFEFSAVAGGLWLIRAQKRVGGANAVASLFLGEEWVTVTEDAPVSGLQVRLEKAYVRGKVVRAEGTPLRDQYASFDLTFHSSSSQSFNLFLGEHGDFDLCASRAVLTLPPVASYRQWADTKVKRWDPEAKAAIPWENKDLPPEGHVTLSLETQSFPLKPLDARLGEESLVIRLPAMGAIRGRVVDAETRSPIVGAHAIIHREGRPASRKTTDSEGAFSFESVPVGPCAFYVNASGYYLPYHEEIEVVEGQEYYIEVNLGTYYIIRGRLRLRETGKPLLYAEIRTKDGTHVTQNGIFVLEVPREGNSGGYPLTVVPLTPPGMVPGLKSLDIVAPPPPVGEHEVDVGDIYVEREEEEREGAGEK